MIKKTGNINIDMKELARQKKRLPRVVGNMAVNHFQEGFRKGGGQTDASKAGWKKRKKVRRRRDVGRAILVDTGALRKDISVRRANLNRIAVGTKDVHYAAYHNEGTGRLPKREFLGKSSVLEVNIRKRIDLAIKKA